MSTLDVELVAEFVVESLEHLADAERQLMEIEAGGDSVDPDLVNTVFRAVHSTKGAAGFFGLTQISALGHDLENVLNMVRNRELTPSPAMTDALLAAIDRLREMLGDVHNSNAQDVSQEIAVLRRIAGSPAAVTPANEPQQAIAKPERTNGELQNAPASVPAEAKTYAAETTADNVRSGATSPKKTTSSRTGNEDVGGAKLAAPQADTSVRVSVGILDRLMNLAGELVLGRNQLLQIIESKERLGLESAGARIDQVTSELQEAIMSSRMQPIGNVFSKFSRIVRDLSGQLGKQCDLVIEGKEVELDKTIIEAIGDPLTHLIRNSLDHGVETPAQRVALGKRPVGTIKLVASHQAGKVNISITDDGAGIDGAKLKTKAVSKGIITSEQAALMSDREAVRLIFHPGFSTAEKITNVSGRGVGMDVVKTNIARIGGTVEIETQVGKGTQIQVKLPLTLAIIPSLIIHCGAERFAIPQGSISELVRVRASEAATKIERINRAEVVRLRGQLLPLVRLGQVFGLTHGQPENHASSAERGVNIIVVETGQLRFGLIVDGLHDSEEIVVKPLGQHLKNCPCLAGATVLGDGHVALILDVAGLAMFTSLAKPLEEAASESQQQSAEATLETQSVLLFTNDPQEHFGIPMAVIKRIERISAEQIDVVGGQQLMNFGDIALPLISLEDHLNAKARPHKARLYVVVFTLQNREIGMIIPHLVDIRDVSTDVDIRTFREPGIIGSLVIQQKTTRLIDVFEFAKLAHPDWVEPAQGNRSEPAIGRILLAEDSTFFRKQVTRFLTEQGHDVVECADGQEAWDQLLSADEAFDLVVTDIEMPVLNGFELCRRIKDHPDLRRMPVIAVTSLSGQDDIDRGTAAGVDEYQVKMDRDQLIAAVERLMPTGRARRPRELAMA